MALHGTAMATAATRRLFTAEEYQHMGEAGILHEDERIELIAGEILQMAPIGSRHSACVDRYNQEFTAQAGGRFIVRVQSSIRLSPNSEPEPDIVLLRSRPDFYAGALPRPPDVLLIVEVADSSLPYDRDVKLPLYAAAGIPEVWLTDLPMQVVLQHVEPDAGGYRRVTRYRRGDVITATTLPDLTIHIDAILP
jgi:Uma2 family endonuclease